MPCGRTAEHGEPKRKQKSIRETFCRLKFPPGQSIMARISLSLISGCRARLMPMAIIPALS